MDEIQFVATEGYGHVDFIVPRFDEFMRRRTPFRRPATRTTNPRGAGTK